MLIIPFGGICITEIKYHCTLHKTKSLSNIQIEYFTGRHITLIEQSPWCLDFVQITLYGKDL